MTDTMDQERGVVRCNAWSDHAARRTPHSAFKGGQVIAEYMLLLAVMLGVTVLVVASFDDDVRNSLEDLQNAAVGAIAN